MPSDALDDRGAMNDAGGGQSRGFAAALERRFAGALPARDVPDDIAEEESE